MLYLIAKNEIECPPHRIPWPAMAAEAGSIAGLALLLVLVL